MRDFAQLALGQKRIADERRARLVTMRQNARDRADELCRAAQAGAERIADLETAHRLANAGIPGYFPTPRAVVSRMIDEADISAGMLVLEPSAGRGSIAKALQDAGARVKCIELNYTLFEYLAARGFDTRQGNFLEVEPSPEFDRVVMNPPFESQQDIDHVLHAFQFLKAGGRLVAIMCESTFFRDNAKSREFREWLDTRGWSDKLPEGAFKMSEHPTGVNCRIVVIDQ